VQGGKKKIEREKKKMTNDGFCSGVEFFGGAGESGIGKDIVKS